jgi:conjugative relaxase-like TrwC/TraI family protein
MSGVACANYYTNLAQEDYYANRQEEPGQWYGQGAERLGLVGVVKATAFGNLFWGYASDRRHALVQNAGDPKRQCCWDLTFSAPKAVSTFWAMADADLRSAVERVHQEAVQLTFAELEAKAGRTRRGPGGRIKEQAGLVFAVFQHGTSRAMDPQLHTHAVLLNVAVRRDGSTGALQTKELFEAKMAAGALYRFHLATGLEKHLGLTIEPEAVGFHVRGVPRDLCEFFSQRSRAIRALLKKQGQSGAIAAKTAAVLTRPRKSKTSCHELFPVWQEIGKGMGWSPAQARALVHQTPEHPVPVIAPRTREAQPRVATRPAAPSGPVKIDVQFRREPGLPSPSRLQIKIVRTQPSVTANARPVEKPTHTEPTATAQAKPDFREQAKPDSREQAKPHSIEQAQDHWYRGETDSLDSVLAEAWRRSGDTDQRQGEQHNEQGQRGPGSAGRDGSRGEDPRDRQRTHRASGRTAQADPQTPPPNTGRRVREPRFIRIERRRLFPKAPSWSPASSIELPAIVIGRPPQPRWAKVRWRKDLVLGHLRFQDRRLFRRAPRWSPFYNLSLPAFRIVPVPQIPNDQPARPWGRVLWHKGLGPFEMRVQKHRLFPRAQPWTRASKLQLPALRVVPKAQQQSHSH